MHLSVKDYCKRYNLSKPTVYKLINDNKIKSFLDGKRRLIEVKQDDKIVNKEVSKTGNLFNHIEVNKTEDKQEIEQLKLALKDKENEVKALYERLIQSEKEQKEEIKRVNEEKDKLLFNYMNLINEQSKNLLKLNEREQVKQEIEDVIDVTEEIKEEDKLAKKKYWNLNEFTKLMKEKKGYKKSKIFNLINEKIEQNDPRFILQLDNSVKVERGADYSDF